MKKLYLILLSFLFICNAFTQIQITIYTPNGSLVPNAELKPEYTTVQIATLNNYIDVTFPNAIRLTDASNTYNCHGYVDGKSQVSEKFIKE